MRDNGRFGQAVHVTPFSCVLKAELCRFCGPRIVEASLYLCACFPNSEPIPAQAHLSVFSLIMFDSDRGPMAPSRLFKHSGSSHTVLCPHTQKVYHIFDIPRDMARSDLHTLPPRPPLDQVHTVGLSLASSSFTRSWCSIQCSAVYLV